MRAKTVSMLLVIVVLGAISGSGIYRLFRPKGTTDFDGFYAFGRAVIEGKDIYADKAGRRYPPTFALFMAPFALLPYRAAGVLFIGLNSLSLIVAAYALARIAYQQVAPRFTGQNGSQDACGMKAGRMPALQTGGAVQFAPGWNTRTVVPCLLAGAFIAGNFFLCQVNLLVLAACSLGLLWAREGKALRAAPAVALAVALKVTPALFFLYFLAKRRFKLLLFSVG